MERQNGDALSLQGWSKNRNKNNSSSGRYKSRGRSKSLGKPLKVVFWKCEKEGHYKRVCKSKAPDKGKGFDYAPSVEVKNTSDEGGDVYLASSSTHVDHEAWLIDSGASFHFTPHREWLCKYEKYDGGDVFLGDDKKARIIGHGKVKLKLQGGKGVRIGTLYKLQGSTIVDGCNNSVVLESGEENLVVYGEKTMLWHQRLGHIGEKGLQILHGKGMSNSSLDFDFYKNCVYGKQNLKTTPYTPQQNGVSERINKMLMEWARSMLSSAGLGHEFWVEVVDTTCYLVSRSPSPTLEDKTPQEVWTGKKPSLSHLRVFGCDAYVHVPKEK
eukprot:PITA_30234